MTYERINHSIIMHASLLLIQPNKMCKYMQTYSVTELLSV